MFRLDGKTALVTGGGRHIGAGIARALARRGAAVAVNDVAAERAEATAEAIGRDGGRAIAMPFDVTQPAEVDTGFAKTEEMLGPVDVLVNNAGVPQSMKLAAFRETQREDWDAYIEVNLYGVLHCTRRVVDGMCERGWGRVITISSDAGTSGLALGVSLYGAGKAGALGFMRHLAMEVARRGVTANSVALGFVPPEGLDELDHLTRGIPVGRGGTPEDVGSLVTYLASEEASWMTGQTLHLDGGSVTT